MLNFKEWFNLIETVQYFGGSTNWIGVRNKNRLAKKIKSQPELASALWNDIAIQLGKTGFSGDPIQLTMFLRHNFTNYDSEMDAIRKMKLGCEKLKMRVQCTLETGDLISGIIDNLAPQQYRIAAHESNRQWVQKKIEEYHQESENFLMKRYIKTPCPTFDFVIPPVFAT